MDSSDTFTGPVNLGNPCEYSIKDLAGKILKLTGSLSTLSFQDLPEDDPVQRKPDISLAKEKLGWEPSIQLEEGLNSTIRYFSEIITSSKTINLV
jgi:UDP-glucuronate decarboxylase